MIEKASKEVPPALRATQWHEVAGAAGGVHTVVTTSRRIRPLDGGIHQDGLAVCRGDRGSSAASSTEDPRDARATKGHEDAGRNAGDLVAGALVAARWPSPQPSGQSGQAD